MYDKILVTLDGTTTDRAIIDHIKELAKVMHSRLVLLHVASGAAARWHGTEAAGQEIKEGHAYLRRAQAEFADIGLSAEVELVCGDPAREIVKWIHEKGCNLVAMSTHGHRLMGDIVLGTTASRVQHSIRVPVLLLRAK
jgi:nucleotide-binding universal stress UspA family protein